jgi:hypothetical protein
MHLIRGEERREAGKRREKALSSLNDLKIEENTSTKEIRGG